jgi:hypothetical protein
MKAIVDSCVSLTLLAAVCCVGLAGPCWGREPAPRRARATVRAMPAAAVRVGGETLNRLNWSPVATPPALPTASLLGLVSPRVSSGVTSRQLGGLKTDDGRLAGLGVLSPRIAPAVVLVRSPPDEPRERLLYSIAIVSPRAAVAIEILREGRRRLGG